MSALPVGYEYGDPKDHYEGAYMLAKSEITVLSDKEVTTVVTNKNEVVGVLMSSCTGEQYSFDIVVAPEHREKGIGTALARWAIDDYRSIRDSGLKLMIDVCNPKMRRILERMGIVVLETIASDRVVMGIYDPA